MKIVVGFQIWERVDMVAWLLDGAVRNFDPKTSEIAVYFDVCKDDSILAFNSMTDFWLTRKGFKWWKGEADQKGEPVREIGGHYHLMKHFMEETDGDFLIVAQDDQHFNQPVAPHLEKLWAQYGDSLGLITGRDGYDWGYGRFAGSFWSQSALHERLQHGEWRQRTCMNSGPIIYSRKMIEKVGYIDTDFWAFYAWDDYGMRAHKAKFVNGVLGMDITHEKFGRCANTTWYLPEVAANDVARVKGKHGLP